ncbi:MAG TPA: hypothetical protein VG605_06250 [Puia sp.]|nr:hypothetical protein [Puia sp.]
MYLLIISAYEFGQFLRILLWICMPAAVLLMLVTTWIHYRRRQKLPSPLMLSMEGMGPADAGKLAAEPETQPGDGRVDDGRVDEERSVKHGEEDYKENLYKGILWIKEKYEQYRDLADARYERLKEQLTHVEKRYEDLLASVQEKHPGVVASSPALDEQLAHTRQRFDEEVGRMRDQLEEKQRMIADLEGQLTTDRLKIEELVTKLRHNSQLLTNIYRELDKSLHFSDGSSQG